MSLASDQDIEEFADDLRDVFGDRVDDIMLFGSYARGEHVPGSDIDILVLLEDEVTADDRKAAGELTAEYFESRDLFFSTTVLNSDEFHDKKKEGYSFHEEVAEQGVSV